MPTEKQLDEMFDALVENGLSFIERSASELSTEPTLSVAHFATGLELLLKARLFAEHWTLIATTPHASPWSKIKSGEAHTIAAKDLCSAVMHTTGTPMSAVEKDFSKVFQHRNKVLHFVPHQDPVEVEAEQCRAWYRLHHLLTSVWQDVFGDSRSRIDQVEATLRGHRPYLKARFEALEAKLTGLSTAGLIAKCPACEFASAEMKKPLRPVVPFRCEVCGADGDLAEFECGNRLALYDLPTDCACGEEHTKEELFDALDANTGLSPKEASMAPDAPICGECLEGESMVVEYDGGEGYQCLDCGVYFEPEFYGACDYCSTPYVGYDLEGSYLTGCELCDGRLSRDD